jgi:cyclopropane-fatty-acyl-phospholipid synthase
MISTVELAERRIVPDPLIRLGIRRLVAQRLREERRSNPGARRAALGDSVANGRLAIDTDAANAQHYEIPAEFFGIVLGPHLKYSAGYWPEGVTSLAGAEAAMLGLYADRAQLEDGQRILDLGCGWGSFSLWAAERYPNARITSVSNSRSQRAFIEAECGRRGLMNVDVVTADVNDLMLPVCTFDRVVSVEMFEHVRDHRVLLERVSTWLAPQGRLFVHVFCHQDYAYPFETEGDDNWMGRYFFTGGMMPAKSTLAQHQDHLELKDLWTLSGVHYQKTAAAWLAQLDARRPEIRESLQGVYGPDVDLWVQRWRMFFMACEELFGYAKGDEWRVCHYLFQPRR